MELVIENTLFLKLLEKKHPEAYLSVQNDINTIFENILSLDEQNINNLFDSFCTLKGISHDIDWLKEPKIRREMVAVMLLTFDPQKIHGFAVKRVKKGIIKHLTVLTGVSQQLYSYDINIVCDFFKIYNDYKVNVLNLAEKLKEK